MRDEAEASVSFSIVGAPMVYEVTVDEGIENGDVSVDPASGVAGTLIVVTALPHEGYRCDGIYVNGDPIEGNTFELPEGGATVGAVFVVSSTKTATYTVVSKTEVETTGEVPEDSEATFECNGNTATQLTGGTHMTLTLKGYEGATITGLTLSMKSNARAGAGSLEAVCGDAVIAAIANSRFTEESWYGNWSTSYVDITPAVTPTVVDGDVVITISASANSIYCESFTVEYEPGTPLFSVALDPAEDFEVIQNEEASVTATAKNAAGEVTYAWTVDGVAAETDGPVLALPTDVASETPHVVVCVATDTGAEGVTAEATVSYTVVPAPVPYAVTIAEGIENGSVSLELDGTPIETPIDLLEGTEVTVVATPDDGFALEAILVNGEPIDGDTFTVAGATEVSATFAEIVDYATLPFLAEGTPFTGPWQNPDAAGVTSEGLDTAGYTGGGAACPGRRARREVRFRRRLGAGQVRRDAGDAVLCPQGQRDERGLRVRGPGVGDGRGGRLDDARHLSHRGEPAVADDERIHERTVRGVPVRPVPLRDEGRWQRRALRPLHLHRRLLGGPGPGRRDRGRAGRG